MARYGKKSSAPKTKITRVAGYADISPNSGIIISITTIGKRLI